MNNKSKRLLLILCKEKIRTAFFTTGCLLIHNYCFKLFNNFNTDFFIVGYTVTLSRIRIPKYDDLRPGAHLSNSSKA